MGIGNYENALSCFLKVLKIEKGDYELYLNLGHCKLQLMDFNNAVIYYKKAMEFDQMQGDPWFFTGKIMEAQEKWLEAAHFFRKATQIETEKDHFWGHLAGAEHKLGNINAAQESYEQALLLNPDVPENYLNFAEFYSDQGFFKEASDILQKGTWELPEEAVIYYELVAAQLKSGDPKDALLNLESALALNYEEHKVLLKHFPDLKENNVLYGIIQNYKTKS